MKGHVVAAHPEVWARADRREPWRVERNPDPNNGSTNPRDRVLTLPDPTGPPQEAIRLHEALHAAHTPPVACDPPLRMAEEVRMDVLARRSAGRASLPRGPAVRPSWAPRCGASRMSWGR